ncbi:hypothetical protein K431DRAFT_284105 [Polychaeton citri CBS 116435]|uniref:Secreted protein n=1 Tax=Polychaeton citri CBS 116435 TaxID=1314669 RepID=A0A9P4UPU6_9PEZI|nr:hypothetical protein K431DRAFT_284105 [Polychaeton citri CBS 116435]
MQNYPVEEQFQHMTLNNGSAPPDYWQSEQQTHQAPVLPPRSPNADQHGFPPYDPRDFQDSHTASNASGSEYPPMSNTPYYRDEKHPVLPPRPSSAQYHDPNNGNGALQPQSQAYLSPAPQWAYPPPPVRVNSQIDAAPLSYTRDPRKLTAYLIPFPKPRVAASHPLQATPDRFLIYTPPPPPLHKPKEGEKEAKAHKLQRKWEEEVRDAKTSDAKLASWKGVKGRATKGIDWAMARTKGSDIDFLGRAGGGSEIVTSSRGKSNEVQRTQSDGTYQETESARRQKEASAKVNEMILVYPSSKGTDTTEIRKEFVDSMLRSKTKAQRDAVIATGLLPFSFAADVLLTFVWPFGGLVEIDGVWAYSSFRGAKTSRDVAKRLNVGDNNGNVSSETNSAPPPPPNVADMNEDNSLRLTFLPSEHLSLLERYLMARCHERDPKLFPDFDVHAPTPTEVIQAIGWRPSRELEPDATREDIEWETLEVKEDFKRTMEKGAREWDKWLRVYEKDPAKALKK